MAEWNFPTTAEAPSISLISAINITSLPLGLLLARQIIFILLRAKLSEVLRSKKNKSDCCVIAVVVAGWQKFSLIKTVNYSPSYDNDSRIIRRP